MHPQIPGVRERVDSDSIYIAFVHALFHSFSVHLMHGLTLVYNKLYIRHRARACEARSGRGWSPSEASSTMSTSNDEGFQRSTINVVDDGLVNDRY